MFNPFYNSSYYDPSDYYYDPYRQRALAQQRALEQQRLREARAQQLYNERLQRARYLPDEVDDEDFDGDTDWAFRTNLERQRALERRRQEEEIIKEQRTKQEKLERQAREEEEARREAIRQAHRQLQAEHRAQQPPRQSSPPYFHVPISSPSEEEAMPPRSQSHSPPAVEPVQPRHSLEEQNEAATKIQTAFRVYRALASLKDLETQFDTLVNSFSLPSVIDFQGSEGPISVSVPAVLPTDPAGDTPKLAYDSTNYALHSYTESLNRLLIKLDGVESWGDPSVRRSRRRTVGKVEAEANRIDMYCKSVWAAYAADSGTDNTQQ
ncbi:hypothetical protein H0H92_010730 [Tricholoma furcatifolium]|nr:hypothetical protein H0H92_010730 [Tricholoma furcatifolium]